MEKLGSSLKDGGGVTGGLDTGRINNAVGEGGASDDGYGGVDGEKSSMRPRHGHQHRNSVDGSSFFRESIEAKKAMAPDKLAELWTIDPKRAKRYVVVFIYIHCLSTSPILT